MTDLLKNAGIRATDFRIKLLEIIRLKGSAISSLEIEDSLGEFDRVTLYRSLKTFKEKGVIHEINMENEPVQFALCSETCSSVHHHHEHIHFKCKSCQNVTCEDIPNKIEISLQGFIIDSIGLQATGVCKNCNTLATIN